MTLQDDARTHAARYSQFVTQVDAPTLKAAFDKSAALLKSCADELDRLTTQLAAVTAESEAKKFWRPCQGVARDGCDYLASCGTLCNKCGHIHHNPLYPHGDAATGSDT